MKKIAYLLGIMMIEFLISACVQEVRPLHIIKPIQQIGHPQVVLATGDAKVDAKYLHSDNAYVRTTDDAGVGVVINHSLSALSTARSTVYYYDNSRVGWRYLDYHGAALRMKDIPNSAIDQKL